MDNMGGTGTDESFRFPGGNAGMCIIDLADSKVVGKYFQEKIRNEDTYFIRGIFSERSVEG